MRNHWDLAADVVVTVEDVLADLEPGALESWPVRPGDMGEPR